MAIFQVNLV